MIFVGVDWASDHHDLCVMDELGSVLEEQRVSHSAGGLGESYEIIAKHCDDPSQVIIGIETSEGLFFEGLVQADYVVYPLNPLAVSRYRDRHGTSGAKSDQADAKLLADIVRTDRHNHSPALSNSDDVNALSALARGHVQLCAERHRQMQVLKANLGKYFPAGLQLLKDEDVRLGLAVLKVAPGPTAAKKLSIAKLSAALKRGGRKQRVEDKARQIQQTLQHEHFGASKVMEDALSALTLASADVLQTLNKQIEALEETMTEHFEKHPDAAIFLSFPGIGSIIGARVLGEFGDVPERFCDARARKNYSGTSPVTRASGRSRSVHRRWVVNTFLNNAALRWAYCSLTHSQGARAYYDTLRGRGKTHWMALRQLANKLVGQLHHCLEHRCNYEEAKAWTTKNQVMA